MGRGPERAGGRGEGAHAGAPPRHVAIIMDGNRRWAERRALPRALGHREGVEAARRTVRAALASGIEVLTLYGFSSENWSRPAAEVDDLMGLLRHFIRSDLADLVRQGVRVKIIGERGTLAPDLVALIEEAELRTAGGGRLLLVIAFNYGARDEIARAARLLAEAAAAGLIDPATIGREAFESRLDTAGLPDPDLVIRTSGEQRLSNFLLWQAAYAELVFLDRLWPDFSAADFEEALRRYGERERRFGARERA